MLALMNMLVNSKSNRIRNQHDKCGCLMFSQVNERVYFTDQEELLPLTVLGIFYISPPFFYTFYSISFFCKLSTPMFVWKSENLAMFQMRNIVIPLRLDVSSQGKNTTDDLRVQYHKVVI
jgi:hypothetical protein